MSFFDFLNAINDSKKDLIKEDPLTEKDYVPFMVNRGLSYFPDTIMFANEMNKYNFLPKKLQYDFFINTIRKKKRFSPWLKQEKIKDLEIVKSYYGYSNEKAKQALRILTKTQLDFIKSKLETGGTK